MKNIDGDLYGSMNHLLRLFVRTICSMHRIMPFVGYKKMLNYLLNGFHFQIIKKSVKTWKHIMVPTFNFFHYYVTFVIKYQLFCLSFKIEYKCLVV